jgi:hypothetical protein
MSGKYLHQYLDTIENFPFDIQHDVTAVRELDESDYSLCLLLRPSDAPDLQIQIGTRITQLNKFDPTERIRKMTTLQVDVLAFIVGHVTGAAGHALQDPAGKDSDCGSVHMSQLHG